MGILTPLVTDVAAVLLGYLFLAKETKLETKWKATRHKGTSNAKHTLLIRKEN